MLKPQRNLGSWLTLILNPLQLLPDFGDCLRSKQARFLLDKFPLGFCLEMAPSWHSFADLYLSSIQPFSDTFRYKSLNTLTTSLSSQYSLQNTLLLSCSSHKQKVNKSIHPDTNIWLQFYPPPEVKLLLDLSVSPVICPSNMLWHTTRTALLLPVAIIGEKWLRHLWAAPFTIQLHKDTRHLPLSKKSSSHRACIKNLTINFILLHV